MRSFLKSPLNLIIIFLLILTGCHSSEGYKPLSEAKLPARSVWVQRANEAALSSPALIDLNNDGVLDIVQGYGTEGSDLVLNRYVRATNGKTGKTIWELGGMNDMVGNATFAHITNDNILDIFIGGRDGELHTINGATGERLWQFDKNMEYQAQTGTWFNFYTSQPIPDQNNDGVKDLVTTTVFYYDTGPDTHVSLLLVLDGANGDVLAIQETPEGASVVETYMSPLILENKNGSLDVIFGTGGEAHTGSLWRASLASLVAENLAAIEIFQGNGKGLIPPPALADMNGDGQLDIVMQAYEGHVHVYDGNTNGLIWEQVNDGFETYSSPIIGYFVGYDKIPDVFISINKGVWFNYSSTDYVLIDGKDGTVKWRETLGDFAPSGSVAVDLNGDGVDELIFSSNIIDDNSSQIYLLDTTELIVYKYSEIIPRLAFASFWIGDMGNDSHLDLITSSHTGGLIGPDFENYLVRYRLEFQAPEHISWQGYLGNKNDGIFYDW